MTITPTNPAALEARASAWAEMTEAKTRGEATGWTDELVAEFDAAELRFQGATRSANMGGELPIIGDRSDVVGVGESRGAGDDPEVRKAFDVWMRSGDESLARAQGTTSGAVGLYTVPQGFRATVTETLKQFGGVRKLAEVISTDDGADLPWPTNDDTSNVGVILSENTAAIEQDAAFGQKILKSYMYSSKIVRVSLQLAQDAGFPIDTWLARKLGERIGRAQAAHWVTGLGSGSSQPQGLLTGLTSGKTTASATAITYNEIVDLFSSVDPAYLEGEGVAWIMHSNVLAYLMKLRDDSGGAGLGRPLIEPSVKDGMPLSILGFPIQIDNSMPSAITTGQKTIVFGNIRAAYVIRDVRTVEVQRLVERYADYLQIGFHGFGRADGMVQDVAAAKYLTQL
jgi:HK97 family phage major capsid protein